MSYTTLHSLNLQEPFKYNLMCVHLFRKSRPFKGFYLPGKESSGLIWADAEPGHPFIHEICKQNQGIFEAYKLL